MVGAIIQARMGSTRLPKKTLADVAGKPLLWHVVTRLKKSGQIEKIVIATTTDPSDDEIERFAKENQIECHRGSVEDVLNRFIQAGERFGLKEIVRVCADSPLIDIQTIDEMIETLQEEKADLVTISPEKTSLLDGFEVTHLEFLKKLENLAEKPYHREHVTYLAKERPTLGRIIYFEPPQSLSHRDIRITVDTQKDLDFIREVYKWLYEEGKIIDVRRLEKLPFYLFRINEDIHQKPADKETLRVKIVTENNNPQLIEIKQALEKTGYIQVEFLHEIPSEKSKKEVILKTI